MPKHGRTLGPAARATGAELMRRLPSALGTTRAAIRTTTGVVDSMPTAAIRALAAGSAGLGAGLYLGGAPRLVVAAGLAPAVVLGAAALSRSDPLVAADPGKSDADATADDSRFDDDGGRVGASRLS